MIAWSIGMMSTFVIVGLKELGSKTRYHALTSLKMSRDLIIHHAGS